MKSEKIIEALGKIDDQLVTEVYPGMPIRKKNHWPTILATAAVVGVCIFGAGKIGQIQELPASPIAEMTSQEQDTWELVKEKLLTAPNPDGIDEEIILEFLRYFQENYDLTFQILLDWEWRFAMSDRYQSTLCPTLYCTGKTEEGIQTNEFVYLDGEVNFASRTVEPYESVSEIIRAAFPGENITATVRLQDRKGHYQQHDYELLPHDGLDVGGKSTLSEELYMEELDLLGQNIYDPAGTLVFVDHQSIPSYFVEEKTGKVYLTCSGKVTNGYAVWAVSNSEFAGRYQLFLEKVLVYLQEKYTEYYKNQYTLRGTVKEIDYENHVLVLDGQAEGDVIHEGPLQVHFSDTDNLSLDNCQLCAYAGADCGFPRAEDTFYSIGYAAENRLPKTAEGCEWYIKQLQVYMRILQNREPIQGNSCSVDIGDYSLFLELPKEWSGKYGMSLLEDGVSFYHLKSKEAKAGGELFTIQMVTEEQMSYAGFKRLLLEGEDYKVGLFRPTDVQFTTETSEEYKAMGEYVESIADSAYLESKSETTNVVD